MKEEQDAFLREFIQDFVASHPKVFAVYGYGSGVIPQAGYSASKIKPEIDLIFVVNDVKSWFQENLRRNPKEFSFLSKCFFRCHPPEVALEFGSPIVYLDHIAFRDRYIKYGVVSETAFMASERQMQTQYVAQRLDKPYLEVKGYPCYQNAIKEHRQANLIAALLLLPKEKRNLYDLMIEYFSISYLHDIRSVLHCEDPHKVEKSVYKQMETVLNIFKEVNQGFFKKASYSSSIQLDYGKIKEAVPTLPAPLQLLLTKHNLCEEALPALKQDLLLYYGTSNYYESWRQALKGVITVGPVKALSYGLQKKKKALQK